MDNGAVIVLGRHVCRQLSSQGIVVLGLGRNSWDGQDWRDWGVARWITTDIALDSLKEIAENYQIRSIIHCAGSGSVANSYKDPLKDFNSAVLSTAIVLEFIRTLKYKEVSFVLVSSAAVYGGKSNVDSYENTLLEPISPYGFNKVSAEKLCESYYKFFGVNSRIVRLFSVYGNGLKKQLLWDAANKFRNFETKFFGTGQELRDWVHVSDAANLLIKAALFQPKGCYIYNGAHQHATTYEVLSILKSKFECNEPLFFTGEVHEGNPSRLTANCEYTKNSLGWLPVVELNEGLISYADWFQNNEYDL
jgi:UDP-glucose 4-epimerase